MFGKKVAKIVTSVNHWNSCISFGTSICGTIEFEGSLKVSGKVLGDVIGIDNQKTNQVTTVVIEEGALVTGSIAADNVIVNGTVQGNIHGTSVHFGKSGKIEGLARIEYTVLQIEPGAQVAGMFVQSGTVEQQEAAKAAQSQLAIVAA